MNLPQNFTTMLVNGFVAGFIASGILCGVFLLLRAMVIVPFKQKKWLKQAKDNGRFAKAMLYKYPLAWSSCNGHELWSYFTYRFFEHGKEYRVRIKLTGSSFRHPDTELTVYWINKPSRATVPDALGRMPDTVSQWFLVSWLLFSVLFIGAALVDAGGMVA